MIELTPIEKKILSVFKARGADDALNIVKALKQKPIYYQVSGLRQEYNLRFVKALMKTSSPAGANEYIIYSNGDLGSYHNEKYFSGSFTVGGYHRIYNGSNISAIETPSWVSSCFGKTVSDEIIQYITDNLKREQVVGSLISRICAGLIKNMGEEDWGYTVFKYLMTDEHLTALDLTLENLIQPNKKYGARDLQEYISDILKGYINDNFENYLSGDRSFMNVSLSECLRKSMMLSLLRR
jgi:hypothetical protein